MPETKETASHSSLIEALVAAQSEFPPIKKTKTARIYSQRTKKEYEYNYASLDQVLEATRPVLTKHGLAVSWSYINERQEVITSLLFDGDDSLENSLPVFFQSEMKSLGSAITYAERYGYCMLIGVCPEEDDDGTAAGPAESNGKRTGAAASGRQVASSPAEPAQAVAPSDIEF